MKSSYKAVIVPTTLGAEETIVLMEASPEQCLMVFLENLKGSPLPRTSGELLSIFYAGMVVAVKKMELEGTSLELIQEMPEDYEPSHAWIP